MNGLREINKIQPADTSFVLEPLDIYQKDKSQKQIAFRLSINSYERTLTAEAVNNLLDKVAERAKSKFGAERV